MWSTEPVRREDSKLFIGAARETEAEKGNKILREGLGEEDAAEAEPKCEQQPPEGAQQLARGARRRPHDQTEQCQPSEQNID